MDSTIEIVDYDLNDAASGCYEGVDFSIYSWIAVLLPGGNGCE